MQKPKFTIENFLKTVTAIFVILYAIFNFIGMPKKNSDSIAKLETKVDVLDSRIREQDKDISKINGKLESINNNIVDVRTDVRALTTILMKDK